MSARDRRPLRIGVDVGGTFTKAVAVDAAAGSLLTAASVPTTHGAAAGVTEGVAEALASLLAGLDGDAGAVDLVAFSTTQAMNALLEGDVARVGVIGLGAAPDLRPARRRTRIGSVALAPGRELHTEHEFIDAGAGISAADADGAIERLRRRGCEAIAVSGAYAVDAPAPELLVAERARAAGLPCCCGHELSGAYGLETRTVSAAINAAILPVVERTAGVVEAALATAGIDVPLLVLRGDGGAMGIEAFRRRPSFTVGSGPAAGVAAALQSLGVRDAIVIESGGTSSNVSIVRGGRPELRSIRVMGRPTAIRSIDSWVVGAAGGSMARLGRRGIAETGPRSAHVAGLKYACFAAPEEIEGAEPELIAPREGDPDRYAVVRAGGRRYALTATCAANALGLVEEGSHALGDRVAALAAFKALARATARGDAERVARQLLDGAVGKIAAAVAEAAHHHGLDRDVPLVALGGAAGALAPAVARRLGRPLLEPDHAEVLSSIGAALSLIRSEVCRSPRTSNGDGEGDVRIELARAAERDCVASGAAPASVRVETSYEPDENLIRAVATGAVPLESGALHRRPAEPAAQQGAAAAALKMEGERLELVAASDFYRVFSENGSGRVAVIDALGGVALAEMDARRVLAGSGERFVAELRRALERSSVDLGVASILPRVTVVCGPRMLDLSDARDGGEIVSAVESALAEHGGTAIAVVAR